MARAGMIELDAIPEYFATGEENAIDVERATKLGVRILAPQHLQAGYFGQEMDHARLHSLRSAATNLSLMVDVAERKTEIADALARIYSTLRQGAPSIVEAYCGGCMHHWRGRSHRPRYAPPLVFGASRFESVDVTEIKRQWPQISGNCLYVLVPETADYESSAMEVFRVALLGWPIQQIVVSEGCSPLLQSQVRKELSRLARRPIFFDVWNRSRLDEISYECTPVRAVILDPHIQSPIPTGFAYSPFALQLVILPAGTRDPMHPYRAFGDVIPGCVTVDHFLRISAL